MMGKVKIIVLMSVLLLVVIGGYLWQAGFWDRPPQPYAGPVEKITLGSILWRGGSHLYIAEHQGYFKEHGLEVIVKSQPISVDSLRDLREGRIDLACCAEFGLVGEIFAGVADIRCLAVMSSCQSHLMMARRDQGINHPADLRGKTIGVPRGTVAEFFLGRFLTLNGLALEDINLVHLHPPAVAAALSDGRVDAVMIWEPIAFEINRELGDTIISWPGQGNLPYYWLLVSTDNFIKARPHVVEGLVRALRQAELYLKNNQEESIAIVAGRIGLEPAALKNHWSKYTHELSFDQSLLLAMEDEARWMIQNRLTDKAQVPNYLDYLATEALGQVNPRAVRLVLPIPEKGR
jgi:ABC-type nitrate/sulfonate/bicarbonate transport system substrate-binding protein